MSDQQLNKKIIITMSLRELKLQSHNCKLQRTPAVHTNKQIIQIVYTIGQLQCVLYRCNWCTSPSEKRDCVRSSLLSVCQKRIWKQWNGDKMRKWSHTFSTCPKTTHPHSPLIHHGSCCHVAHAKLSFPWISRKAQPSMINLFIYIGLFVCLFFLF